MLVFGCALPNPSVLGITKYPVPVPLTVSNSRLQLHQSCRRVAAIKMGDSSASFNNNENQQQNQSDVHVERVTVLNNYGEKLVGVLHETGSAELIILCHGFRSSKESSVLTNLASSLTKEGMSVFRFDFAGNGESEGSFEYGNYRRESDDLRAVIQYFSGLKRPVGAILGHSKGGNVVLLYASKYHDVPQVVNVSGRYNLEGGIKDRLGKEFMQKLKEDGFIDVVESRGTVKYRVTEESLRERLSTDMHAACLSIGKGCRVLTVHGSLDEIIPVEDAHAFDKVIANDELQIIEGADHGYNKHHTEFAQTVLNFLKAAL